MVCDLLRLTRRPGDLPLAWDCRQSQAKITYVGYELEIFITLFCILIHITTVRKKICKVNRKNSEDMYVNFSESNW